MTSNAKLFNSRITHWTRRGKVGAAVYEAMATDESLPPFFSTPDVAAIVGLAEITIRQRRARRLPPAYLKTGHKAVKYPRAELARWFATSFVEAAAA